MLLVRPRRSKVTVFRAKGTRRIVRVTDDGWMSVRVRYFTWAFMPRRRRQGRPIAVLFALSAIRGGWFRPARWWRPGVLFLDVPMANDPWQIRTKRQVLDGTFPKPKPHKIRFRSRQQPAFEECALQIGVADVQA